ncbi:MAG: hypothetical protein WA824_18685 [Candidatus Sulfotelmatobacter sp.]
MAVTKMRRFAIFAMLAAIGPWAAAQRGGGAGGHAGAPVHAGGQHVGKGTSVVGRLGYGRSRFGRYGYGAPYDYLSLPFPSFDDAYDSGDIYSTGYPVAAPLPPYLPPLSRDYGSDSFRPQMSSQTFAASQPLIIELQNGRYVQVSSAAVDGEAPLNMPANSSAAVSSENSSANSASEANNLAPVVLIFKNGDRQQVRSYTIMNGILYAQGDYYTDGYWNKKIDLSALNVAETLQANAQHGVKFVLPSSPNEVVTRP